VFVPDQPQSSVVDSSVFFTRDHVKITVLIDVEQIDAIEPGTHRVATVKRLPLAV